ncbi:hypothetical protein D3C76_1767790 [compost metagenome]
MLGHALVEGRVEHRHMGQAGQQVHGGVYPQQAGGHLLRRQRHQRLQAAQHLGVQAAGGVEQLAAVQHMVAHAM